MNTLRLPPLPRRVARCLGAVALVACALPALAEDGPAFDHLGGHPYTFDPFAEPVAPSGAAPDAGTAGEPDAATRATLERLRYIESVVAQRVAERAELAQRLEGATEREAEELRDRAADLAAEIKELRGTFESIATGGIDSSLFAQDERPADEGDWRSDLALVAQPVIDSMKEITEKPRRISEQNDIVAARQKELEVARAALDGLAPELAFASDEALVRTLEMLERRWRKRAEEAEAAIEIARFEIANLRGDKPVWRTVLDATWAFATGRGLTLVLAVAAAAGVFFGSRFALSGYRRTLLDRSEPESRTRYRLAEYGMHAGTGLLMLVGVFIVFYQRGDVLLLGLMILLFVGLALGARQVLPRYVEEAKLLLNIGPMREGERVVYQDLPWRVESVNMYSVLRNPELDGVLRVPLARLHGFVSRPVGGDEPWFPTSRGDVVLLGDDAHGQWEVVEQNPDTVSLRERGGETVTLPSARFYRRQMTNLVRGGGFGVTVRFGIDYAEQARAATEVPELLRDAVHEALARSDVADRVRDVRAELEGAGDSSLDYWLFATFDAGAATSYRRIERLMQQACVQTCTAEGWSIPFPHLSVVSKLPETAGLVARKAA